MDLTIEQLQALMRDEAFASKVAELLKAHLGGEAKPRAKGEPVPSIEDLRSSDPAVRARAKARVQALLAEQLA